MSRLYKQFYFILIRLIYFMYFKKSIKNKIHLSRYNWQNYIDNHELVSIIKSGLNESIASEYILGKINRDGKLISNLPYFPNFDVIDDISTNKKDIKVSLVIRNGMLTIKKDFGKNRKRYINELLINSLVLSKINVPDLLFVDDKNNVIYKSVIRGRTIRDLLVKQGAKILLEHTEDDPAYKSLSKEQKIFGVWAKGKKNITKSLSIETIETIISEVRHMHKLGVCKISLTYGNIIIDDSGMPWFLDFENSIYSPKFLKFFLKKHFFNDFQKISYLYK